MPDLETQLRRYGTHLEEKFPDVALDEIVAGAQGRARQAVRPVLRLVIAIVAVVGVVGVGLLVLRVPADLDTPAPIITPVPDDVDDRTPPGDEEPAGLHAAAPGLVLAAGDGVWLVPFDAPEEAVLLPSDGYGIAWAMSDGRGGLIFQHNETPDIWPRGAILWLRAGAVEPEILVPPPAGPWDLSEPAGGGYPIAGLWPFGVATSSDGHAMFVYTADTEESPLHTQPVVMVADLDGGGAIRQLATLESPPNLAVEAPWLLVGGDTVAVVERSETDEGCEVVTTLLRVDDGAELPATADCLPGGELGMRALSHDGRTLAAIGPPDILFSAPPGPLTVEVIDLVTGPPLEERSLDLSEGLGDLGLLAIPDGWLVYLESGTDFVLVDLDGNMRTAIDMALVPKVWEPRDAFWPEAWETRTVFWPGWRNTHFYLEPFELAGEASLGPSRDQD